MDSCPVTMPVQPGGASRIQHETPPGILLVAFGLPSRLGKPALAAFTRRVREAFPGHDIRWAFTSRHRGKSIKTTAGSTVSARLEQFAANGVHRVAVQALHIVPGREHTALCETVARSCAQLSGCTALTGKPLVADASSLPRVTEAILAASPRPEADEAIVWVGHGSRKDHTWFTDIAAHLAQRKTPVFMGMLAGTPCLEYVLGEITRTGKRRVRLMPFFALAGNHTVRDMGGEERHSWRTRLTCRGIECHASTTGLAAREPFAALWLERLRETLSQF